MKWVMIREITPNTTKWYGHLKNIVIHSVSALEFNDTNLGTKTSAKEVLETIAKELTRWIQNHFYLKPKLRSLNLKLTWEEDRILMEHKNGNETILLFEVLLNPDEATHSRDGEERSENEPVV